MARHDCDVADYSIRPNRIKHVPWKLLCLLDRFPDFNSINTEYQNLFITLFFGSNTKSMFAIHILIYYIPSKNTPIYNKFSNTKIQNVFCYSRFPIPYHHSSLRRFPVFAVMLLRVIWYNGTRTVTSWTEDVRTGNMTLKIHAFST